MRYAKKSVLLVTTAFVILALMSELAIRATGAVDFPLYDADDTIGYIPKANQSGSFLNKNDWVFNELHMGSLLFAPSAKVDVLIVGDSIVLSGNPLKQNERLAPQVESISDLAAWPISAGSWALRNQLTYLRHNISVVDQVDAAVFVLNTDDLENASSWKCELSHPRTRPSLALWYLFKKYVFNFYECNAEVASELAVKNGDLLIELKEFLKTASMKTRFILYPDKPELADLFLWEKNSTPLKEFLQTAGARHITDIKNNSKWKVSLHRDGIHPNAAGNAEPASVIASVIGTSSN